MEDRKNMKLEDRVALAMAYHDRGFNCAQAVACAYCDKAGIDEKTMFQLTEGFGLGMGGMKGTCGAAGRHEKQHRQCGTPGFQGGNLQAFPGDRQGIPGEKFQCCL